MTDMQKMAVVRRYFTEFWNKGNLDIANDILAPSFGSPGGAISGPEAARLYVSSYRSAFPRIHFTLLSLHCQGDMVVACWVGTGAHDGSETCPEAVAPGKERTITGLSVYRLENGKIADMWMGCEAAHHDAVTGKPISYHHN
jgi:hypothetical protein